MKIVIIGNSGSGKTWLAEALSKLMGTSVVHFDDLFWEPGGFDRKRPPEAVDLLISDWLSRRSWVAEGVFGELATRFLPAAQALIWLDLDWKVCRSRLERRGSESKRHLDRLQSEEGLRKLTEWASQYYERTDMRSHHGHERLFTNFNQIKHRFNSQNQVDRLIASAQQGGAVDALTRASDL